MKWARILVANKEKNIPKEVEIIQNGLKLCIPIWSEEAPRFEILPESSGGNNEEDDGSYPEKPLTQRTKERSVCNEVRISNRFRDLEEKNMWVTQGQSHVQSYENF